MSRENRIQEYLELLDLGDELYECNKHKITRKTTSIMKSTASKDILTSVVKEEIEFS